MNIGGEYLAAAEGARGAGSAPDSGPRVVLLSNLDDVRRWLDVEEATPISQLKGFKLITVAEALTLRQDDPELGTVAERAASLGLPLLECERTEVDPIVRDMLPAPVSRRLGALPLTTNGPLLAVLVSNPETTGAIEFMVARRAATTITRLLDLGVLPFLLKSTLLGVLAQRLGRRNCKFCKVPEPVDPHMRKVLGVAADEVFYVGQGCPKCEGRGIKGRIGIYELLEVTPEISKLIVPGADANAIHDLAEKQGMLSITKNAVTLARAGVISLQEAFSVRVD